jgi:hypothetical protein
VASDKELNNYCAGTNPGNSRLHDLGLPFLLTKKTAGYGAKQSIEMLVVEKAH